MSKSEYLLFEIPTKKCLPVGNKYFLSDMKEWENVMEYKEYFTQNTGRGRQTHCSTQWVGGGDG